MNSICESFLKDLKNTGIHLLARGKASHLIPLATISAGNTKRTNRLNLINRIRWKKSPLNVYKLYYIGILETCVQILFLKVTGSKKGKQESVKQIYPIKFIKSAW